jgi:hypothetical protein
MPAATVPRAAKLGSRLAEAGAVVCPRLEIAKLATRLSRRDLSAIGDAKGIIIGSHEPIHPPESNFRLRDS